MTTDRLLLRRQNILNVLTSLRNEEPIVRGFPVKLTIEPTNICDLKCPLCPTGAGTLRRGKGMLSFSNFRKVIDDLDPFLCRVVLWNYGESFINPSIFDMIAYARDHEIETVCSTNGYPLHHRFPADIENLLHCGLDHLIVSVDGARPSTHATYRVGSELPLIIRGLRELVARRAARNAITPVIDLQFIAMRHNQDELAEIQTLAAEIGVDRLSVKTANLTMLDAPQTQQELIELRPEVRQRAGRFLPTDPSLSRYDHESLLGRGVPERGCSRLWEMVVVNQDGEVALCCYDVNASMSLGNAFKEDVKTIWNSEKYQELRQAITISRRKIPLCSGCTDGAPKIVQRLEMASRPARAQARDPWSLAHLDSAPRHVTSLIDPGYHAQPGVQTSVHPQESR